MCDRASRARERLPWSSSTPRPPNERVVVLGTPWTRSRHPTATVAWGVSEGDDISRLGVGSGRWRDSLTRYDSRGASDGGRTTDASNDDDDDDDGTNARVRA